MKRKQSVQIFGNLKHLNIYFCCCFILYRDYKKEYEKLRNQNLDALLKQSEEKLSKIKLQGPGTEIKFNPLVTDV